MGFECARMTEAYLSLWKLLDMRSPDHQWLEFTAVSEDELKSEISRMARQRLPWAGNEEQELKEDIKIALESLQAAVTPESAKRLDQLRNSFQDKALGYAAQASETKVTDVARNLMPKGELRAPAGVDAAIRELGRDVKRVQEAISMLRTIHAQRTTTGISGKRGRRRLSAQARRRISETAKKRRAALRAAKTKRGKGAKS